MPQQIPKTFLGMHPLPFTTTSPFAAIKQRPEGGKINAATNLSRISNGGYKLTVAKKGTKRNRGPSVETNFQRVGFQTNSTKTKKTKGTKGNISKLVKNVKRLIKGKRKIARSSNGKFIAKGG